MHYYEVLRALAYEILGIKLVPCPTEEQDVLEEVKQLYELLKKAINEEADQVKLAKLIEFNFYFFLFYVPLEAGVQNNSFNILKEINQFLPVGLPGRKHVVRVLILFFKLQFSFIIKDDFLPKEAKDSFQQVLKDLDGLTL